MRDPLDRPGAALAATRAPSPRHLGSDDFAPDVAARVHAIDPTAYDSVYVVGDVHGCRRELVALLDQLDVGTDDLVVFVGDLVRKGPDSRGVLELVRSQPNMVSVCGNNEAKLIRGEKTLPELEPFDAYLESLPVAVLLDDTMVVHGGVDPRKPLFDHTEAELLNARSIPPEAGYDGPFWFDLYEGPTRVCFGHTVLAEPAATDHVVGLDTGCVYGGTLTAYDLTREELSSVPAERTYLSRSKQKIVQPSTGLHAQ